MSKFPIVLVVLGLVLFMILVCLEKVPLDRVGVITDNFKGGVEQKDREPGYSWIWPGMQTLALWDPTIQVIHLEKDSATDGRVHIRGKDQ